MQRIGRFGIGRRGQGLLATTVALLSITTGAQAATITVNSTSDAALPAPGTQTTCPASCSLREAVQVADNVGGASTILLLAGTYTLTIASTAANDPSTGDLDVNNKSNGAAITINGAGSSSTTIDANGIDRAFAVQPNGSLTLSGLTIIHGKPSASSSGSQNGGAIYTDGALTVTGDVVFRDNGTPNGGAIYADATSTLSIAGASFQRNRAAAGGAIDDVSPQNHASITRSGFVGNSASTVGGAIAAGGPGSFVIDSSTFNANSAGSGGGAIAWGAGSFLTVVGSSFSANTASGPGGAIAFNSGGPLGLSQDEFDGNSASTSGGAVEWTSSGPLSSTGSSYIANSAVIGAAIYAAPTAPGTLSSVNDTLSLNDAVQGAGIFVGVSTPATITNDTIAFNNANAAGGGGIFNPGLLTTGAGATGISNTIIAQNGGGDCGATAPPTTFAASFDIGHNLDGDGTCLPAPLAAGDKSGVNPLLAQPANNGGSVQTDAELIGSPAIGAGSGVTCPLNDARGEPRAAGSGCDIGAFEFVPGAPLFSIAGPAAPVAVNTPVALTIKLSETGAGPLTNATVVDQLPAGVTFWGAMPSQGSCTNTTSAPVKVTCALGLVNPTSSSNPPASVSLVVSLDAAGTVTDSASLTDDQGANRTASATANAFATLPAGGPPSAQIGKASPAGKHTELLLGQVNPGGEVTRYFFQYGPTRNYGAASAIGSLTPASTPGPALMPAEGNAFGLKPGARYHYRLVAINGSGVSFSADASFRFGAAHRGRRHRHHH